MEIWLVTGGDATLSNLAAEEHDAIAWFTTDELVRLDLVHSSYLDVMPSRPCR